jgi:tRNA-dihydrouridine synthase
LFERTREADGFRHTAPTQLAGDSTPQATPARGHHKWVINKLRALNSWYTKGLENGSHLRTAINSAESLPQLRDIVAEFFSVERAADCAPR